MNSWESEPREETRAEPHEPELDPPFEVVEPGLLSSPLVFSSPHSGRVYPARFLASARLDAATLRRSEDAYVDELFAAASDVGAPLLRARFPRAYLDLNREPYELNSKLFDGPLPQFANTRSLRVAAGLGTIPGSSPTRARFTPAALASMRRCAGSRRSTSPTMRRCAG